MGFVSAKKNVSLLLDRNSRAAQSDNIRSDSKVRMISKKKFILGFIQAF